MHAPRSAIPALHDVDVVAHVKRSRHWSCRLRLAHVAQLEAGVQASLGAMRAECGDVLSSRHALEDVDDQPASAGAGPASTAGAAAPSGGGGGGGGVALFA